MRSRRVRCPTGPCKDCDENAAVASAQASPSGTLAAAGRMLAYLCTAVGPAVGAATAAWLGDSVHQAVGCQHVSAVAIAALCSTIAQCIATVLAACVVRVLGDTWRASVTPGLGVGDFTTLGKDTRKLVRKQSVKAGVKSLASRALIATVGHEVGGLASVACAIITAVTGGVIAAVSIEAAQMRAWSPYSAMMTAYKATYKTAIKTTISSTLKEILRLQAGAASPMCGPIITSTICCGTGIGLRNWIVDQLQAQPGPSALDEAASACPNRRPCPIKGTPTRG